MNGGGTESREAAPASAMQRARARSEAKNEQVRAQLEPLAPGERPGAVTVATIAAVAMAIGNIVATLLSADSDNQLADAIPQLVFITALLGVAAVGMWFAKYWAVLGFQTVLALQIVALGLSLTRAEGIAGVLIFLVLISAGGYLFWKLIRAMARLQMPEPPDARILRDEHDARDDDIPPSAGAEPERS